MRGALVLLIIIGSLPYCLTRPWFGVLMFSWISYMNPHKYAWGPARTFPVAMVVAICTVVGLLHTRDKGRLPKDSATMLMACLWVTFVFTTFYAINPTYAWGHLEEVSKIFFMTFVTLIVINDPTKLRYLLLVIALSVGLLGVKGGIWALLSGGQQRVYGPEHTFLGDNNDFALALNMALPLLFYLAKDEPRQWLRLLLKACFGFSMVAIVFTYSRGGFLTLAVVSFLLLVKAKYKSLGVAMLGIGILIGLLIVPEKWDDRMHSINEYQEDNSVQGRFNAWAMAWNLALHRPLTGGGFDAFTDEAFRMYAPDPEGVHDAHSIYFEMLGEHGFVALGLFMLLILSCLKMQFGLKRRVRRGGPGLQWATHYPDMLQVSIIAYLAGGSFLGRAYFDMFYHLVAATVILRTLVLQAASSSQESPATQPIILQPEFSPQAGLLSSYEAGNKT